MAHTHEFDCKQCGAHLDSRQELDQHVRDKHTAQSAGGADATRSASSGQNPGNSSSGQSRSS